MIKRVVHKGSLIDVETGEIFEFQYNPQTIKDSNGAVWTKNMVQGKHHPLLQYAGGSGRKISFDLRFYMGYRNKTVLEQVNWLRSLCYPDTLSDAIPHRAPHRVVLNMGNLYKGLVCVVETAEIEWGSLMTSQLDPQEALVQIVLEEFRIENVGWHQVRQGDA